MEEIKEVVNPAPVTEEKPVTQNEEQTQVLAGDKTPPNLLLKSLQEERAKAKALEQELEQLKSVSTEEIFSDEGKTLKGYIGNLKKEVSALSEEITKRDLLSANPVLKEAWKDFEDFRADPENSGMGLKTAAKAFLAEKGLGEPKEARKWLEKPSGGPKSEQRRRRRGGLRHKDEVGRAEEGREGGGRAGRGVV